MKTLRPIKLSAMTAGLFAAWLTIAAAAQTEPEEEELEFIVIDNMLDTDEAGEGPEEAFDGVVYDPESRQYQLIADPEDEVEEEPPSQREQDQAEIVRLFALYKEAVGSKNFLEADTLAKQIVELSIRLFGINSNESAKSLTNLAIAQHGNGEYEAAERNYRASIDIIERVSDRLNESLINPLKGLGATQLAIGEPDLARQSFQRAVHVSHVNMGPHNHEQIDVLESMAEIYMAVGEHKQALDMQEKMFFIQSRNIELDDLAIIPALQKQAHWQHRLQMYDRERLSWRKIVNVLERHYGKEDLRLIPPLTSLGKSYLFITPAEYDLQPEISVSSGESYLRRANRIADRNPDSDWRLVESTLLSLGDYYLLSGRSNRASRVYAETWELLSDGEEQLDNRHEHLEKLNILQRIYPPKYYKGGRLDQRFPRDEELESGSVSYGFTVDSTGRATDIMHIETIPPQMDDMRERVRRNIRHLVYRPRLVDGKTVETPDMTYVHEFRYRLEDLPGSPDEPDEDEETGP